MNRSTAAGHGSLELLSPPTPAFPAQRAGIRAVPLRGRRWRVTRGDGAVLGYIAEGDGAYPYTASRMRLPTMSTVPIGAFATAADALDAVRAA